jgi:hypothetical protein
MKNPNEPHDSKEHHVEESKSKKPRAKVDVYHHPHHLEKQNHQGKGVSINKLIMDQHGTRKETS